MGQNNSRENDNLKESCEYFDASDSDGMAMKNMKEKMLKLGTEGTENQKMEIEKCKEAEKKEFGFFVPNWLIEILEWIKRREMANSSLSTSSRTFEHICWPKLHGRVKPHRVPFISTIPLVAPPAYITGFDWITICYLNERILQFFKCVAPMLKNCIFELNNWNWTKDDGHRAQMRELILLLADKMSMLYLEEFPEFDQLFPGVVSEIQCIAVRKCKCGFEPLFKWLTEKRNDGKQKILNLEWNLDRNNPLTPHYLSRIKKEFSASIHRSNFLIWQGRFDGALFTMENKKTGEILELYENNRGHRFLARYPKGEDRWKEEGERKLWPCEEDITWIMWMHSSIYPEFEALKEGIQKILRKRMMAPQEFMELYTFVFNVISSEQPYINRQHFYNNSGKIIRKHLQTSIRIKIMESIGSDYFAKTLNAIWKDHNDSMAPINGLHSYLNRHYVFKTGLLEVYPLGMEIFGKEIVDYPPIKEHLKAIFGEGLAMAKGKIDDSLFKFLATRING